MHLITANHPFGRVSRKVGTLGKLIKTSLLLVVLGTLSTRRSLRSKEPLYWIPAWALDASNAGPHGIPSSACKLACMSERLGVLGPQSGHAIRAFIPFNQDCWRRYTPAILPITNYLLSTLPTLPTLATMAFLVAYNSGVLHQLLVT